MKTAVTVINTIQTGMDNYKDIRVTKVFHDDQSIFEIKDWIRSVFQTSIHRLSVPIAEIGLACVDISDVDES